MANVRIVTDITAYLEPELIAQHRITVLPVEIRLGRETFRIAAREDWDRFFRALADGPAKLAEVSTPASVFQEAFGRLTRETEEILVLLSSGRLSRAYSEAQAAARAFLGRCRIAVVDSMSASWGLGLLVKVAAEAAAEGRPLDSIVRLVRGMVPHIYLVFFVDRLDYLERWKRIGSAQARLGTMLRIKPLLLVEDGDVVPMEKVRTRTMAIEKLSDFVAEFASIQQVVIVKSPLENEINDLVGQLRVLLSQALPGEQFRVIEYDPVLGCHLGPEALGVVVLEGF
jgi:DegV family protein with EDD domain